MIGGCACGAVRFRLASAPYDAGWCHCRICQRVSGAPALAFATVPVGDWVVTAGADAIGRFRSTPFGERQHCTRCGATLTIHVDHEPDEIDFAVASLDDPDPIEPGFHISVDAAIGWAALDDGLPRFGGERAAPRDRQGTP